MASWKSLPQILDHLNWVKAEWMVYHDAWFFKVHWRDQVLFESLSYFHAVNANYVLEHLFKVKKEIDFYLDAIWC